MIPVVRTIEQSELPAYFDTVSTGFLERPDTAAIAGEVQGLWDLGRTWAAFEGERIVGTLRSWATELTVPGLGSVFAAAVSGVGVLPTHRRRGILRSLVAAEHTASRGRGEVVALLYASEYPIYRRFGYGPATTVATWTIQTRDGSVVAPTTGTVELVAPGDAKPLLMTAFEAWRARQVGEIRRRDYRWHFDLGRDTAWGTRWRGFVAVHRDAAGAVDGYARYHVEVKWEDRQSRSLLILDELLALSDAATAALWRFLSEVDLVTTIRAEGRSPSDPLPWLLSNARAAVMSDVGDGLWVRLLDVPVALEARSYETSASLVLEVVDGDAPGGRLRVRLEAARDGAACRLVDSQPDLTVDIAALGAAYLGGTRLRDATRAGGADEHRPGALHEADALFAVRDEPWCTTFF